MGDDENKGLREPERLMVLEEAVLRLSHHVFYLNSDLNGISQAQRKSRTLQKASATALKPARIITFGSDTD